MSITRSISKLGALAGAAAVLLAFSGTAFAASGPAAAPSPCDVSASPFLSLTQAITEPDSGTHGDWANDTFTEKVKVWKGTDGTTFCASGIVMGGTFVTTGPNSPEAGAPLSAGMTGTLTGGETWVLPAGTATTTSASSLTLAADNSTADGQFNNWQSQVFTQTAGASTYYFHYTAQNGSSWTNADPASGGNAGDIIDSPTAPGLTGFTVGTTTLACGASTDIAPPVGNITLQWGAVSGADHYRIDYTYPDGSAGTPTFAEGTATSGTVYNFGKHGTGAYTYTIRSNDGTSLSASSTPCVLTLVPDTTAPTVSVTPVAGSTLKGTVVFGITVNDSNAYNTGNGSIYVYLYNNAPPQKSQGMKVNLTNGHGLFTVNTTKLLNGTSTLDVGRLQDASGNFSGKSDNYFKNYVIANVDLQRPFIASPHNGTTVTSAAMTSVTWTPITSANGTVTYTYEASDAPTLNADGSFAHPIYVQSGLTTNSINTPNTPPGTYYVHAMAKDSVGGFSLWSPAVMVTVTSNPSSI